ncbi:tyrosine-type recombinase/integrase [Streptosporangium saharense]|uniref:tyrosine-type recombinase/integrase n=1 Tax=Streptosporangium saharense TaxID=1706840 RepID=UPI0034306F56
MKVSYGRRCGCKDLSGKRLDAACPDLSKRRHGTHGFTTRLDTTEKPGRQLKRFGYSTKGEAEKGFDHVHDLVKLAGDDDAVRRRIGDMIFACKRGADFPDIEEIRHKLKVGVEVNIATGTVGELLEDWYKSRRGKKESTMRGWRQHLDHYLIPLLGPIRRDRLKARDVDGLFDTIEEWNAEILAAREEKRPVNLPDDVRTRHGIVSIATQHRILATLRNALNWAVKRRAEYGLEYNPCLSVELPPEERDPARVWSPEQVAIFLETAEDDPLYLLFRLALLRGLRRGEACGTRVCDVNKTTGHISIVQTVLQLGGRIVMDTPKSQASKRLVSVDEATRHLVKAHVTGLRKKHLAAGEPWSEEALLFARQSGEPYAPDRVSARFKEIAAAAGLPVIKFHEARHTAATLGLEANLDVKVVSAQLGHSTTRITQDLYQHVRQATLDEGAEKVLALLPEQPRKARGTRS